MNHAAEILAAAAPIMPVASFSSAEHAEACAALFAEAGVPTIEVTLRHPEAWRFVGVCRELMPAARIGVGTVVSQHDMRIAMESADFAISPGFSPTLCGMAVAGRFTYIPGIATASELMQAVEKGFDTLKFFPAEAAGGLALLRSLSAPFPKIRFCPTGGIDEANCSDYLALPSVLCVGSSAVVPSLEQIRRERNTLLERLTRLYQRS